MFTRVTIQGSLVALQQHIRAKAPAARDRSHSLDESDRHDQRCNNAINNVVATAKQSTTTPPRLIKDTNVAAQATSVMKEHHHQQQQHVAHTNSRIQEQEEEEEVILAYDGVPVSEAPTATYHFGLREVVVHNVCSFLEIWVNSFKTNCHTNQCNPHGWECLRRKQTEGSPSCHSNSFNNYNTAHASCGHPLHYLYGTTIPTISMKDYLLRLTEYFRTSDAVFIVATHYFSRVVNAYQEKALMNSSFSESLITPWSLHRIYFTCCVLAAKWLEDTPFDNQYYASVGGISTFELSAVETELLKLLDFNIFVSRGTVDEAWEELQVLGASRYTHHNLGCVPDQWHGPEGARNNVLTMPQCNSMTGSSSSMFASLSSSSSYAPLSVDATPYRPAVATTNQQVSYPTTAMSGMMNNNHTWYRGASVMPYHHHQYQYQYYPHTSKVSNYASSTSL